jgi:hypothetical protein
MWDNHEEFSDIVNVPRPNWRGVTDFFTSQGFRSIAGKELRPNAVVKTWERVQRRYAAQQGAKKPKQPSAFEDGVVREVSPELRGSASKQRPVVSPVSPTGTGKPRVSPVKPVSPVSPVGPTECAKNGGSGSAEDENTSSPDEVMRALDEQFNARRQPMPKPVN